MGAPTSLCISIAGSANSHAAPPVRVGVIVWMALRTLGFSSMDDTHATGAMDMAVFHSAQQRQVAGPNAPPMMTKMVNVYFSCWFPAKAQHPRDAVRPNGVS